MTSMIAILRNRMECDPVFSLPKIFLNFLKGQLDNSIYFNKRINNKYNPTQITYITPH